MDYEKGDKVKVTYGEYAGRIGTIISFRLKDVNLEFDNGDGGTFSYYNIKKVDE